MEYQKYEFCKAIHCMDFYKDTNKCMAYVCSHTAKQFHKWLKENNFKIVKADNKSLNLTGEKHPAG